MARSFTILLGFLLLLTCFQTRAQTRPEAIFGNPSISETNLSSYSKDPEASGVVLYEKGKNYVKLINNNVVLIKEVHKKIKVFDAAKFDQAEVLIPIYQEKSQREKVTHLKAITHNGAQQTFLSEDAVYETDETANWSLKRFTFPNVKDGSILEYTYRIESPYFAFFGGWEFQGALPKIYSEFESEMPGNFVYHKSLIGTEKLAVNEVSLKKDCFFIPGFKQNADCELGIYAMYDVPAFKEEDYMLAAENYKSRIDFELREYTNFKGIRTRFTQSWDDVDKEFRFDKDLGRQLGYTNFFKDKLPPGIVSISDPLKKARAIYYFIQKHFIWNGKQRILSDIRVKQAFEEGSGNSSEINLALINALEAAGFNAKIALLSTRDNSIPTQLYPVMTEFNYAVVCLKLNSEVLLLDAVDKNTAFGMLPFRALNSVARVLDFKEGSYWIPIVPHDKNVASVSAQLRFEEPGKLTGIVKETFMGYNALEKRNQLTKLSLKDYVAAKADTFDSNELELSNYTNDNLLELESAFSETYNVTHEADENVGSIILHPFFLKTFIKENPFKLEKRSYPVDFGHPQTYAYSIAMDLNGLYKIDELPANKIIKLPDGSGECSVLYSFSGSQLNMRFTLRMMGYHYTSEKYQSLKEFYSQVVQVQSKEVIILNKI